MKWMYPLLTTLGVYAFTIFFGFTLTSFIAGAAGGLITSFAIHAYLNSVNRDCPSDHYETRR